GRTLSHAYVILDEAQNATINQFKMFLTRMGENAKFIVTGDITQIDLPNKGTSGLTYATRILEGIPDITILRYQPEDIIRHRLVTKIVEAFDAHTAEEEEAMDIRPRRYAPSSRKPHKDAESETTTVKKTEDEQSTRSDTV
ncbi:MAG: hypothetical protein RIS47_2276, partial [Bacteroidota bacterium]